MQNGGSANGDAGVIVGCNAPDGNLWRSLSGQGGREVRRAQGRQRECVAVQKRSPPRRISGLSALLP